MITLTPSPVGAAAALELARVDWEALLLLALDYGWRPRGARNSDGSRCGFHEPRGQFVGADDAASLARALRRARETTRAPDHELKALEAKIRGALAQPLSGSAEQEPVSSGLCRLGLTLAEAWRVLVAVRARTLLADAEGSPLGRLESVARAGPFWID